jgi:hypothetical protein
MFFYPVKPKVVSWYHFQRMNVLYGFTGGFDEFFELFLQVSFATVVGLFYLFRRSLLPL